MKARGYRAWTLRSLGAIHAARAGGSEGETERVYTEARRLAGDLGMRPLVARCDLEIGEIYSQWLRPKEAAAALTRSAEQFRSLGMLSWCAQAEQRLERSSSE
jgi:hypothetical protein